MRKAQEVLRSVRRCWESFVRVGRPCVCLHALTDLFHEAERMALRKEPLHLEEHGEVDEVHLRQMRLARGVVGMRRGRCGAALVHERRMSHLLRPGRAGRALAQQELVGCQRQQSKGEWETMGAAALGGA